MRQCDDAKVAERNAWFPRSLCCRASVERLGGACACQASVSICASPRRETSLSIVCGLCHRPVRIFSLIASSSSAHPSARRP